MNRILIIGVLLLFCCISITVESSVDVYPDPQKLYFNSFLLQLHYYGLRNVVEGDIVLDIGSTGFKLNRDVDFNLAKIDESHIYLELLPGKSWISLNEAHYPALITLSAIYLGNGSVNVLSSPTVVATIVPIPSIDISYQIIYACDFPQLRLTGTGLVGADKVNLYFSKHDNKEIIYTVASTLPLEKDEVIITIHNAYTPGDSSGPLILSSIDTGSGIVVMNGDVGVQIAQLQVLCVFVNVQPLYSDQNLRISGTGFSNVKRVHFDNEATYGDINYFVMSVTPYTIELILTRNTGALWRSDALDSPANLTVISIDNGDGLDLQPVGHAGRTVAVVFKRPTIDSQNIPTIKRTLTHSLRIKGSGFPLSSSAYKPLLRFYPTLYENLDYNVTVIDRTEMLLTLKEGRSWKAQGTTLKITGINTRGDAQGWLYLTETLQGAPVALVEDDYIVNEPDKVEPTKKKKTHMSVWMKLLLCLSIVGVVIVGVALYKSQFLAENVMDPVSSMVEMRSYVAVPNTEGGAVSYI